MTSVDEVSDVIHNKMGSDSTVSPTLASVPTTTCVSPVLEGKPVPTNSYIEALLQNSNNNIACNLNNSNLATNINTNNPYFTSSPLCQLNGMTLFPGILTDYYTSLLQNTNNAGIGNTATQIINSNVSKIPQSTTSNPGILPSTVQQTGVSVSPPPFILPHNPALFSRFSGLYNTNALSGVTPQPAIVSSNTGPKLPVVNPYNSLPYNFSNWISPILSPMILNSNPQANNQNLDDIKTQSSTKLRKTVRGNLDIEASGNYSNVGLNRSGQRGRIRNSKKNSVKLNIQEESLAKELSNVKDTKVFDTSRRSTSEISTTPLLGVSDQLCNIESSEMLRLHHARKYRLGDQGRALLKSELSAYLRNNPEKRIEANKVADIRNATTKQLWQIAAMCGLEERFINLHAQSLAQSKEKMNIRGIKRKSSTIDEENCTGIKSESIESSEHFRVNSVSSLDELASLATILDKNTTQKQEDIASIDTNCNVATVLIENKLEITSSDIKNSKGTIGTSESTGSSNSYIKSLESS
ncbi:hypothetical protein cand_023640 [Cryptosporidium andersoni]|uniref:Uncharacterized protein n=1 Tax=Cryptosporidium andersoni TaxID=117008 RepID=A0A1J4MVV5_9CRYT|nr:hypothetical protein cand_023640 [Cryptosporidium andersoni]